MGNVFLENLRVALDALWNSKVRGFLTMLGIIIGVFSISLLIGIGEGVKQDVTDQVTELGSNVIAILPGSSEGGFNPAASVGASTLTEGDLEALRALPALSDVTPVSLLAGVPTREGRTAPGTLTLAVEESYFTLFSTAEVLAGRTFTKEDLTEERAVVILDTGPRLALFPDASAESIVGETVRFGGTDFTVIGVVETPQTSSFTGGPSAASTMFVPYSTAAAAFENTQIFRIIVQAGEAEDVEPVAESIRALFKERHDGVEDVTVMTQEDLLELINDILGILTAAVAGIASISLVVGGIGIMNIMLVSVTERTKEIGIRKAIGASNRQILSQFLTESMILSLLGGLLGLGLALLVGIPIESQAGFSVVISLRTMVLAAGFSLLVGVVFGVTPAIRAARLNPIQALRYE